MKCVQELEIHRYIQKNVRLTPGRAKLPAIPHSCHAVNTGSREHNNYCKNTDPPDLWNIKSIWYGPTKIRHAICTQRQPFWMLCSWLDSLLAASPHSRYQFETWRVVFRIPKDRCQHVCQCKRSPCKHGSGEGYRGQRLWKEAWSVLYIHSSLEYSKLFCTLPCCSKSWVSRMTLHATCTCKKFRC